MKTFVSVLALKSRRRMQRTSVCWRHPQDVSRMYEGWLALGCLCKEVL